MGFFWNATIIIDAIFFFSSSRLRGATRKSKQYRFNTIHMKLILFDLFLGYMVLGLSLAVVCVILGLIVKYWNDIIDQEQLKKFALTAL